MLNLLWIPLNFGAVLGAYFYLKRQGSVKTQELTADCKEVPSASARACVDIVDTITTNNSYDPMGYVLASLTLPQVRELLGEELRADMGDYMP